MGKGLGWIAAVAVLWAGPGAAQDQLLRHDRWPDAGVPEAPVLFPPGHGAGVAFELDAGGRAVILDGVEVYLVPLPDGGTPGAGGTWRLDVWDHRADGGCLPPRTPQGNRYTGDVQLTVSDAGTSRVQATMGSALASGSLFVSLRTVQGSAPDGVTIAVDQGPAVGGASWYFDPQGGWSELGPQADAGAVQGLDRNWILRAVIDGTTAVLPVSVRVVPSSGANDVARDVTVQGAGYSSQTRLQLGPTWLTVVERRLPDELVARVPAGFRAGTWDLTTQPAGGFFSTVLPAAYTVLDGSGTGEDPNAPPLTLASVTPSDLWAGAENGITVQGTGFDPGIALKVGAVVVYPLEWRSAEELGATLPPRSLPVGTWDVAVFNPSGRSAVLPQALRVRGGAGCGCGCFASGATADAWLLAGLVGLALRRRRRGA